MVNEQNLKVFINCGAGCSRSSTIFLAFIALFGCYEIDSDDDSGGLFAPENILHKDLSSLVQDLLAYLKCYHKTACPNV